MYVIPTQQFIVSSKLPFVPFLQLQLYDAEGQRRSVANSIAVTEVCSPLPVLLGVAISKLRAALYTQFTLYII